MVSKPPVTSPVHPNHLSIKDGSKHVLDLTGSVVLEGIGVGSPEVARSV